MFAHGHNIAITGGCFVDIGGNSGVIKEASYPGYRLTHRRLIYTTAFKELQKASAPSAFHNSGSRFDPPKCHPNTRVAVLEYLMGWIAGRNDPEALILWLYGPAGAGKSAILQTISERCFKRKVLLATFFFGRSDPTRNTFKPLIATIAYQLATAIPEAKLMIESAIERDPLIFDKSIATQFQLLIVDSLMSLAAAGFFHNPNNWPGLLILLDGLDECDDPRMQSMILRTFANALRDQELPLIILISSRPEQHISLTFNSPPLAHLWRSLVLDASFRPDDDIRLFLEDSFQQIKFTHPHRHLIPAVWPKPSDVNKLIQKSSGQFIYASVVVKYVSAPVDRPHHRLEVILGLRPTRGDVPFAELDALYMHILDSCSNLEIVLLVLGIAASGVFSGTKNIEILMDLERGDVEVVLAPLTSIINLCWNEINGRYIQLCHASFGDFLLDNSRSGRFHIDIVTAKENITIKCLQKLMDPYSIPWDEEMKADDVLFSLWYSLSSTLRDEPLTVAVLNVLKEFSLPKFWSSWSFERGHYGVTECERIKFIIIFLNFISEEEHTAEREQICAFHLSSFESIFKSEIRLYYQDVGLMSLVVVALLNERPGVGPIHNMQKAHKMLFRLTEELIDFDDHKFFLAVMWGARHVVLYYPYLFTNANASAEFYLDGMKYCQTALRILEFLCNHPPRPILYQTPRLRSTYNGPSNKLLRSFSPRQLWTKWSRDINLPRKRRAEKHRYGVALSFPLPHNSTEDINVALEACSLGLSYLPGILRRSSKSPELMDFIRMHGKNIAFIPKSTKEVIRAMYEYLDRPEEDTVMVDLAARFEAMVIE